MKTRIVSFLILATLLVSAVSAMARQDASPEPSGYPGTLVQASLSSDLDVMKAKAGTNQDHG